MKKENKRSPTDGLEPTFSNENPPPFGFDICGRRILHRDGRPGYPRHIVQMEMKLFKRAMKRYRKRTHLKLNVSVWSFADVDTAPMAEELSELRRLQMEVQQ